MAQIPAVKQTGGGSIKYKIGLFPKQTYLVLYTQSKAISFSSTNQASSEQFYLI